MQCIWYVCGGISSVEQDLLCKFAVCLFPANLTGYTEKVGMENFELLKVLGTGGESAVHCIVPSRNCFVHPAKVIGNVYTLDKIVLIQVSMKESYHTKDGLEVIIMEIV